MLRSTFVCSYTTARYEHLHTGQSGAVRIKDRRSRRPGYPTPSAIPHAFRQFFRNSWVLARIGCLLGYAYAVELFLRWENSRGRLDLYTGDGSQTDPAHEQFYAKKRAVAAE